MLISRFQRMFSFGASFLVLLTVLVACGGTTVTDTTIPPPPGSTKIQGDGEGMIGTILTTVRPVLDAELKKENVTSDKQEAYTSTAAMTAVVDFYKAEMKTRGWTATKDGEKVDAAQGTAVLAYESGKQGALIMIFDMAQAGDQGLLVMTANASEK